MISPKVVERHDRPHTRKYLNLDINWLLTEKYNCTVTEVKVKCGKCGSLTRQMDRKSGRTQKSGDLGLLLIIMKRSNVEGYYNPKF